MTIAESIDGWTPWAVDSNFEISGSAATVSLRQVTDSDFEVPSTFRFRGSLGLDDITERLRIEAPEGADIEAMVDDARTFPASSERTDLASIPRFLTWFENKYGRHTLAAIIHDRLIISGDPNAGALGSDTLADRFFRVMLLNSGVPALKAWIMWAAVAMRTRWAGGGVRRWSLVLWTLLAVTGITATFAVAGVLVLDWHQPWGLSPWFLGIYAFVMPFISAPLWGKQYGASMIAALAALWILPPAALTLVGFIVYRILEVVAGPLLRLR